MFSEFRILRQWHIVLAILALALLAPALSHASLTPAQVSLLQLGRSVSFNLSLKTEQQAQANDFAQALRRQGFTVQQSRSSQTGALNFLVRLNDAANNRKGNSNIGKKTIFSATASKRGVLSVSQVEASIAQCERFVKNKEAQCEWTLR